MYTAAHLPNCNLTPTSVPRIVKGRQERWSTFPPRRPEKRLPDSNLPSRIATVLLRVAAWELGGLCPKTRVFEDNHETSELCLCCRRLHGCDLPIRCRAHLCRTCSLLFMMAITFPRHAVAGWFLCPIETPLPSICFLLALALFSIAHFLVQLVPR